MKTFGYFVLFLVLATVVIVLAALLGNLGAWYFAWLIGTVMIVLVAAAGAALLDAQEERRTAPAHREVHVPDARGGGAPGPGGWRDHAG